MGGGWGVQQEFEAAFVWIICIGAMFAFFKFASLFANATAKKKGLDPQSPEGVEVAWKNLKWIAPLLLLTLYVVGSIGRSKGWWGD